MAVKKYHRTKILGHDVPTNTHEAKPVLFVDDNNLIPFQPIKLVAMQYQGILEMLIDLNNRIKELENA